MKKASKIIAFSDSHGDLNTLIQIVEQEKDAMAFFFAGDGIEDFLQLQKIYKHENFSFYGVVGNCDWASFGKEIISVMICDKKILLTHGHLYRAKQSLQQLVLLGKEHLADLVIYGHTHQARVELFDGLITVNPGACGTQVTNRPTYNKIYLEPEIHVEFITL